MQLALKVDVDTLRGTQAGVPSLVAALRDAGADATFLFSVGPDHTGRAIRRVLRPGFLAKVGRTSVFGHYGARTLMYGTLLPGPHIGRRAGDAMRAARDAGFEVGVHCHDHVLWQDSVAGRDAAWTQQQMELAVSGFAAVFGTRPRVHGAAGWQMNDAAFRLEERLGFIFASDTRGEGPFVPFVGGRVVACPQLPTTLPTLDELLGRDGVTEKNVHETLLGLTARPAPGRVFTLHAELEGMRLLPVLLRLVAGWHTQGYRLVSLGQMYAALNVATLPRCEITAAALPGRSGRLAMQGRPVPASTSDAVGTN